MSTTLSQARTKFRNEVKIDPNGKVWDNTMVNGFFNDAYLKVQADGHFNWPGTTEQTSDTVSLVAGTQEYTAPTNIALVELVTLSTTPLYPIDFVEAKRRNLTNAQGTPSRYYFRGEKIGFDPIPNSSGTVNIYFRAILASLSADGDTIKLPDNFVPAIVKYMAYLAWSSPRGNYDTAQQKLADYERELSLLKLTYLVKDLSSLDYSVQRRAISYNRPDVLP